MVSEMPNLRYLKIAAVAHECPKPVPANLPKTWLGSLEKLRGKHMQMFELQVPESYAGHFDVCEASHSS